MSEKEAPQRETWEGQNFDTLELEVDKEIDSLFVPAPRDDEDATAGAAPGQESHSPEHEPSGGSTPALNLDAAHIEIDREIDQLFVPSPHSATSAGASNSPEAVDPGVGISGLIEQFNAAYLSLDWDFSRENLKKFLDSLEQLEPRASRSTDAKSLFRIMEVILKRLLQRPHAVNTQLFQLIRDSQGLLAHLLLIQGESGPQEKRRLKELLEKFQDLRQKALAAKAAGVPPAPDRRAPAPGPVESPLALSATEPGRSGEKTPLQAETEYIAQALAPAPEPRARTEAEQLRVRHADAAYLLVSEGKWLALPASCVVKTTRSTRRMGRKVLKRGHATLSDFKPSFRGTKNGVLGEWAKLRAKELRSYRFEPMEFGPAGSSSATGLQAVLTSDGQTHRIIFCDAVNFIDDVEIAEASSSREAFSLKTNSHVLIPFYDLNGLMSSLPGSPSIQEKH